MMIDFALEAERERGQDAGRSDLPGVPAALPAHHDDHHGGAAGRRSARTWARGVGSELRQPLGITIIGGLMVSQVLTLYTTPVVYLFFDRLARAAELRGGRSHAAGDAIRPGAGSEPFVAIHQPPGRDTSLLTVGARAGRRDRLYDCLPVAPLPQVEFPTIQVSAGLPGASPEIMASSVATPLERQFGRIAGVTEMTSSSSLGSTNITLQFDLNRDIDAAARDVQAAINAARGQLPANLPMQSDAIAR